MFVFVYVRITDALYEYVSMIITSVNRSLALIDWSLIGGASIERHRIK